MANIPDDEVYTRLVEEIEIIDRDGADYTDFEAFIHRSSFFLAYINFKMPKYTKLTVNEFDDPVVDRKVTIDRVVNIIRNIKCDSQLIDEVLFALDNGYNMFNLLEAAEQTTPYTPNHALILKFSKLIRKCGECELLSSFCDNEGSELCVSCHEAVTHLLMIILSACCWQYELDVEESRMTKDHPEYVYFALDYFKKKHDRRVNQEVGRVYIPVLTEIILSYL